MTLMCCLKPPKSVCLKCLYSLHPLLSPWWAPAAPLYIPPLGPIHNTNVHVSRCLSCCSSVSNSETEARSYSQITKTQYRIHFPETRDFVYLVPQLYVHYYCNIQMLWNKIILSSILIYFTDSKIYNFFFILTSLKLGSILKSMKRKYWVI